jgi:3-methylcrotonyl-CoA carboxylase alpha subunit
MFRSVLIANRGEIAIRVMAACQEMGIRTIAVYSEADANAAHVRAANEAYCIGPAPARESYLNIEAILRAAKEAGAEAIHPGYGFLSENAEFAEACARAGVVFIGPPAEAIRLMGSKTAAKAAVERAGVPTVPGYAGEARDLRTMQREAARIGYPVMLKASAGGGGKGMRAVASKDELPDALAGAQREALAAFGDDSIFLEKLLVGPRHIEFQILADTHGNVIHLGERECSIQRRHQKVIEESPSIALTPELRATMGEAAVRAARAAGYVNAGTCEFLLDESGSFYFLEMNTRLQVEHPVTELVMGVDLVRLQLRIAAGERLPLTQEQIAPRGHAIEARLYAEDPANGYLPSVGRIAVFAPPRAPGVRVDAGVATGDEVSVHYDPMLAKLIVSAPERAVAIERLAWALDRFAVLGVATNIPLLRGIAAEEDYRAGRTTTAYLDTHDLAEVRESPQPPPLVLAAAALWEAATVGDDAPRGAAFNPWTSRAALGAGAVRRFRYATGDQAHLVVLTPDAAGEGYAVTLDGAEYDGGRALRVATQPDGAVTLYAGDLRATLHIAGHGLDVLAFWRGIAYALRKPGALTVEAAAHAGEAAAGRQSLTAPMAGTVLAVNVSEGDAVEPHQPLAVLGAMKMEHAITSPYPARVLRVLHQPGDVVPGGEVLLELETGASGG